MKNKSTLMKKYFRNPIQESQSNFCYYSQSIRVSLNKSIRIVVVFAILAYTKGRLKEWNKEPLNPTTYRISLIRLFYLPLTLIAISHLLLSTFFISTSSIYSFSSQLISKLLHYFCFNFTNKHIYKPIYCHMGDEF